MTTGHHHTIIIDDTLTILLVEEKPPSIQLAFLIEYLSQQVVGLRDRFRFLCAGLVDGEG